MSLPGSHPQLAEGSRPGVEACSLIFLITIPPTWFWWSTGWDQCPSVSAWLFPPGMLISIEWFVGCCFEHFLHLSQSILHQGVCLSWSCPSFPKVWLFTYLWAQGAYGSWEWVLNLSDGLGLGTEGALVLCGWHLFDGGWPVSVRNLRGLLIWFCIRGVSAVWSEMEMEGWHKYCVSRFSVQPWGAGK